MNFPILSAPAYGEIVHSHEKSVKFCLDTRMAGLETAKREWDTQSQNCLSYSSQKDSVWVLEAEITLDNANPGRHRMRIGIPFAMIGTDHWLDIVLRFTGQISAFL